MKARARVVYRRGAWRDLRGEWCDTTASYYGEAATYVYVQITRFFGAGERADIVHWEYSRNGEHTDNRSTHQVSGGIPSAWQLQEYGREVFEWLLGQVGARLLNGGVVDVEAAE